ncbi:hypothetical protein SLE2022_090640 [Rubroshorea leprosula]
MRDANKRKRKKKKKKKEEVKKAGRCVHSTEMIVDHPAENDCAQSTIMEQKEEIVSSEDMQDGMDQFTYIMQQTFLSGGDHQYLDYSKIDEVETLDDHWLREANHDAEEKYFADY